MYSGYDMRECFNSCKLDLIKVFDNINLIISYHLPTVSEWLGHSLTNLTVDGSSLLTA